MTPGEIAGAMTTFGVGLEEAKTLQYIGDGVYVSHDDMQIWLRTLPGLGRARGEAIALNDQTWAALVGYHNRTGMP